MTENWTALSASGLTEGVPLFLLTAERTTGKGKEDEDCLIFCFETTLMYLAWPQTLHS